MKRHLIKITLWSALCVCAPATTILAEVPSVMNFQAILLDDQGQIVPDSTYEIEFRVFEDSLDPMGGGGSVWMETQTVQTSGGLFNTMLGVNNPLTPAVFTNDTWLQMRLTSSIDPFLPRTRIGATAYTYRVASLDGSKGGEVSGTLVVDTAQVGRSGVPGRLSVLQGNASDGAVFQPFGSLGTSLKINDEAGNACVQLRPDNSGEGGWLYVHRNAAGAAGFTVEGNTAATLEPSVRISGSSQSIEFDLTETGSATVALTPDAIDAGEIADEPGVASNMESSQLMIGKTRTNLLSRSIVAPADGFVFLSATAELSASHDSGRVYIGLTNDPVAACDTLTFLVTIDSSRMDDYTRVVHLSAVLPVAAGVDTYYLFGREAPGSSPSVGVRDRTLCVLYFPTHYGTVVIPSAGQSSQTSPTAAELDDEREAQRIKTARIEREMAAMKARLLELEQTIQDQPAATDAPRP